MKKRGGRCQQCCCLVADDDSAWEACAETWADADPLDGVITSDSDAELLFLNALDSGTAPWRVSAYVAISQPATATWEVKLRGGSTGCGGAAAELIWGHDADGEYFELHGSRSPWDTTLLGPVGAGTRTYSLTLCWDGAQLSATAGLVGLGPPGSAYAGTLVATTFTPTGTRAGLATGTLVGVSSVLVYNFAFEYLATADRATCDECSPDHCCEGPIPPALLIELAGLGAGTFELQPGVATSCDGDCTAVDGSYYAVASEIGGDADGYCEWRVNTGTLLYAPCPPVAGLPTPDLAYNFYVRAWVQTESGTKYLYVTVAAVSGLGSVLVLALRAVVTGPCASWTSWTDLAPYYASWLGVGFNGVDLCGFGGSPVARFQAIP